MQLSWQPLCNCTRCIKFSDLLQGDLILRYFLLNSQDVMKGIMLNFEKLIKEMGNKEVPEARAYLRILGEELGYMKLNDFKLMGNVILKSIKTLQAIPEKVCFSSAE